MKNIILKGAKYNSALKTIFDIIISMAFIKSNNSSLLNFLIRL